MSRQLMPALAACALISMPAAVMRAQEVQQSAPIVSRDAASRVSAFSYEKGPESELLLRGTTITPLAEGEQARPLLVQPPRDPSVRRELEAELDRMAVFLGLGERR